MAIETDADRAIFFDPDEFGGIAVVTIDGGEPFEVEGIYESPHFVRGIKQDNQFTANNSADVSSQKPTFRTRSSALAGVKSGRATIVLHTPFFPTPTTFKVWDVGHDSTGIAVLRLMKA